MADGKHEAIIDEKIFYEAQKKRGSISREKKDVTLKNPFAGIMVCGRCGAAMIMKKYTDKRNKNNKDATYILCSRQSVCHTKSVKYSKISEIIKDSLLCILPEFEIDMSVCRQKENSIDVDIDSILNNIHLMKKKDERQKDAYENGIYSKEEYKLRNEELQSQIKKAEEDARMQKKMLELALQQSDFRFWDYDIKTHRLYRSWAVTQQVGFGEYEENVPEGFVELGLIHPDDCEAYLEFYHNVQQGKNQRLTFRAIHQNGEWGWMDIAYRVFFNEQGEPVRAIGVGGDVSKQREKEQKYLKDFELFRDVSIYAIQRVFLDVFLVDIPTDSIRLVLAQGGYMNMKEIQGYDKILNQKLCRYVRDKEDAVKKLSIAQIKKNIALTKDHKLEYTFELRNEKGRKCWYKYYISYFHENTEKLQVLVKCR